MVLRKIDTEDGIDDIKDRRLLLKYVIYLMHFLYGINKDANPRYMDTYVTGTLTLR